MHLGAFSTPQALQWLHVAMLEARAISDHCKCFRGLAGSTQDLWGKIKAYIL